MTTYYVKKTGSDSNAGTSEGAAWLTIGKAVDTVAAGDTVKVGPGTYNEEVRMISPSMATGTSGNVITFEALDSTDKPRVHSGNVNAYTKSDGTLGVRKNQDWFVNGISYLTIDGFEFSDTRTRGIIFYNSAADVSNVTVKNCDFIRCKPEPGHILNFRNVAERPNKITYVTVEDCYFEACNPAALTGSGNGVFELEGDIHYFVVSGCHFYRCVNVILNTLGEGKNPLGRPGDYGQPQYGYIVGNTFRQCYANVSGTNKGAGTSMYCDRGRGPIVWEGNVVINDYAPSGTKQNEAYHSNCETWWDSYYTNFDLHIVRNNYLSSNFPIITGTKSTDSEGNPTSVTGKPTSREAYYHNTIVQISSSAVGQAPIRIRDQIETTDFLNNVIVRTTANGRMYHAEGDASDQAEMTFDGNMYHTTSVSTSDIRFFYNSSAITFSAWQSAGFDTNGQVAEPLYADPDAWDWTLKSGADGTSDAVALTLANGAGSSSATLVVDDAKFFVDGLNVRTADSIDINGTVRLISSVDYETDTITLASAATWSNNDPIKLAISGSALTDVGNWSALPNASGTPAKPAEEPVASFTASPSTSNVPYALTFTDTSTASAGHEISTWNWLKSGDTDWEQFSTEQNPTLWIEVPGEHEIILIVTDTTGQSVEVQQVATTATLTGGDDTTLTIAAGSDDMQVGETSVYSTTQASARFGKEGAENQSNIFWFELDTAIPNGATVTSALLTVDFTNLYGGSGWNIAVHAEDVADATKFANSAAYLAASWTTASVTWSPSSWPTGTQQLPDISTVIQELVDDNSGLAANAGIQLRVSDLAASTGTYGRLRHYDATASFASTLYLEWTTGGDDEEATKIGWRTGWQIGVR